MLFIFLKLCCPVVSSASRQCDRFSWFRTAVLTVDLLLTLISLWGEGVNPACQPPAYHQPSSAHLGASASAHLGASALGLPCRLLLCLCGSSFPRLGHEDYCPLLIRGSLVNKVALSRPLTTTLRGTVACSVTRRAHFQECPFVSPTDRDVIVLFN